MAPIISITSAVFVHLKGGHRAWVIEGPGLRRVVREVPRKIRK